MSSNQYLSNVCTRQQKSHVCTNVCTRQQKSHVCTNICTRQQKSHVCTNICTRQQKSDVCTYPIIVSTESYTNQQMLTPSCPHVKQQYHLNTSSSRHQHVHKSTTEQDFVFLFIRGTKNCHTQTLELSCFNLSNWSDSVFLML